MDPNHLLIWLVATSGLLGVSVVWRRFRTRMPGWLGVHALNVVVPLTGYLLWPDVAGWVALAVWTPTVLLPALVNRLIGRFVARGKHDMARRVARLAGWLHPMDGWRELPLMLSAHEALHRGDRAGAVAWFDAIRDRGGPAARDATLQSLRLQQRWPELKAWFEQHPAHAALAHDPSAVYSYLRALGELGETSALLDAYTRYVEPLGPVAGLRWLATGRMVVAAFTGQVQALQRLVSGPSSPVPPAFRAFWVATAWQAAGHPGAAAPILRQLLLHGDGVVRPAAERRLSTPLAPVDLDAMGPRARDLLARLEHAADDLARHGTVGSPPPGPPPRATWTFVGLNLLAYAAEIPGGSMDGRNLFDLGALVAPAAELQGEWWRVVTSAFLHFGSAHLVMNMLGLWFFGRYLERMLGTPRFALLYGLAAPGSMALIVLSVTLLDGPPQLVVGASGGVMALIGAILAVLLVRWRLTRAGMARRDGLLLLGMLALQTAFDLATPEVSFTGHAAGAVLGFVLGLVLTPRARFRPAPALTRGVRPAPAS